MTHLATADSDPVFAERQVELFREATEPYPELIRHAANCAAALRLPVAALRRGPLRRRALRPLAVREDPAADGLEPASRLAQPPGPGQAALAGREHRLRPAFVAERQPTWIGLVPVGYADGFRRDLTGTEVRVSGERSRVVGAVSMDAFAVELSTRSRSARR